MPEEQQPIQPLPLGQPAGANPAAQTRVEASASVSLDDNVDTWMQEHPADKPFEEPNTEAQASSAVAETPPGGEEAVASPSAVSPAPPGEATAPPTEPPPTTEPLAQAQPPPTQEAQQPPSPPKPAEPIKFSLDSQYVFGEGGQPWSGQQVVDGLRERQSLLTERETLSARAKEADAYRETFELPAAQAKEIWEPNIRWLRENPPSVQMIASIMEDEQKRDYLLTCSNYYEEQRAQGTPAFQGQRPPQRQQQRIDPQLDARMQRIEQSIQQAENARLLQVATAQITADLDREAQRYPILREPYVRDQILTTAQVIKATQDPENRLGTAVSAAVERSRPWLDKLAQVAALTSATEIARDAAAPSPVNVPPLMGSAGAAPHATAPIRPVQPKTFASPDDGLEDWINNPPAEFR